MENRADVIIIGSGVAGAVTAAELSSAGLSVIVVEAGPKIDHSTALEQYRTAVIRTPESPYVTQNDVEHPITINFNHWYRQSGPDTFKSTYLKCVGGTLWHWLGSVPRFVPNDFRLKEMYGQGIDWPISYQELEEFYTRSETELGVAGADEPDPARRPNPQYPMPPIPPSYMDRVYARALTDTSYKLRITPQARNSVPWNGRPPCCGSASCIPICPIGAKYDARVHIDQAISNGCQLIDDTAAVRLEVTDDDRVSTVHTRNRDGSTNALMGRIVVLAANAIETPRLLLNSRTDAKPEGLANSSDQVGRNLMDHPMKLSWALSDKPVWPYRGPISTSGIEEFRDGPERSERAVFRVQVSNDGWTWPTGGLATLPGMLARRGLYGSELKDKIHHYAAHALQLASMVEQLPVAENRVTLDQRDKDQHGVPLPRIHYRIDEYAKRGLMAAQKAHQEIFELMNATEINHHEEAQGAGHIIGTCRMGSDSKTSVVDEHLRSFDHKNLFVIGSSVFPTSGVANPTLTIVALAYRMSTKITGTISQL